jgi:hypothetical protein
MDRANPRSREKRGGRRGNESRRRWRQSLVSSPPRHLTLNLAENGAERHQGRTWDWRARSRYGRGQFRGDVACRCRGRGVARTAREKSREGREGTSVLMIQMACVTRGREGGPRDSASGGERGGRWSARWHQVMGRGTTPHESRE